MLQIACAQIPTEIFITQSVALNREALANTVEGYIVAMFRRHCYDLM